MDDVIVAKAAIIERCITRAREELTSSANFATDFTRQDAAILNVERACEAAIDIAFRLVRVRGLGAPANSREAFEAIYGAGIVSSDMAEALKRMIGFRNIAVHQYQALDLAIVRSVIETGLEDLAAFASTALRLGAVP